MGCEVRLIGRKTANRVWAVRVIDGGFREYLNSDLRSAGGSAEIIALLQTLPLMKRAAAIAKATGQ